MTAVSRAATTTSSSATTPRSTACAATLGSLGAELNRLPFNGTWGEASWDEPNILRVIRLLDVATTANTAPETNGTNGNDTINGEANEDLLFGQGGERHDQR